MLICTGYTINITYLQGSKEGEEYENIQEKQAYLRENVLEKAYDADEFMSFLQQKKGENGLDLNNWTMNELIKASKENTSEYFGGAAFITFNNGKKIMK